MPTVAFLTLGCKVNQYDSQAMLECFLRAGYEVVPFDAAADVYVVNTCTVTGTGDKKSMQAVRRARRLNPDAQVVIAGCLAQRDAEKLLQTGARLIIGSSRRGEIVSLLEEAAASGQQLCAVEKDILRVPFEPLTIERFSEHTRAALKIQEGCDRYCTYCIIPYTRGGIRSRAPEDIRREAERLCANGYREIVLTGIHLTSWGRDLGNASLLDAVDACLVPGILRVRLGSLEPVIATPDFAAAIARRDRVCRQFHLALQSGSDAVLRRMRRRYTTSEFAAAAEALRREMPRCALTTDIICGFPGETEEEFAETCTFAEKIAFSRIHVFPFSPRSGTPAASMPGQVPKALKEARTARLIALGGTLARRFHESFLAREGEVLVEKVFPDGSGEGYTGEYVSCRIRALPGVLKQGELCRVLVTDADEEGIAGVPARTEEPRPSC